MPELILFDLDGTLADTAPDLALALNMQRERHGLQPLSLEAIRPHASHGSRGLLAVGFGLAPEDTDFAAMRDEYLSLYDEVFTWAPQLFDEMDALLSGIEARGKAWGVVTNKPRRFSAPLMQALNLHQRAACLVCGDDVVKAKPAPDSLLRACGLVGRAPADCVYVGDAERDIVAGRAAGMRTVLALYGYIAASDAPETWAADAAIAAPLELLELIGC